MHLGIRYRIRLFLLFLISLRSVLRARPGRTVVLIGAPFHPNLGDQAQTYCTEEWFRANYPKRISVTIDTRSATAMRYLLLRILRKLVNGSDIVFLHSGYHTTDLYPAELALQLETLKVFPELDIVVLPQTIKFESDVRLSEVARKFNDHGRVVLLSRDEHSFAIAQDRFSGCKVLLYPDIVTSKIGALTFTEPRAGINLCLRNDAESVYASNGDADLLETKLREIDRTFRTDTNSPLNAVHIRNHLEEVLNQSWSTFARYRVTVTDRYHGVIFSLIAGTPVVVLASADHKLESGVRWFPSDEFSGLVRYAASIDEAVEAAAEFAQTPRRSMSKQYFQERYFSKLAAKLAGNPSVTSHPRNTTAAEVQDA